MAIKKTPQKRQSQASRTSTANTTPSRTKGEGEIMQQALESMAWLEANPAQNAEAQKKGTGIWAEFNRRPSKGLDSLMAQYPVRKLMDDIRRSGFKLEDYEWEQLVEYLGADLRGFSWTGAIYVPSDFLWNEGAKIRRFLKSIRKPFVWHWPVNQQRSRSRWKRGHRVTKGLGHNRLVD
jgi:hypothetical protein